MLSGDVNNCPIDIGITILCNFEKERQGIILIKMGC
jgi:hypothetical protein